MVIQRPLAQEQAVVQAFVQGIVDEIYGGLWVSSPVPIDTADWASGWVAVSDGELVGVALTRDACVDDLWICAQSRGRGLGRTLLSCCEKEITARGYVTASLRVVASNASAIRFYLRSGWQIVGEQPHEVFPITMVCMSKSLNRNHET